MSTLLADHANFRADGVFYPTGHAFAMFASPQAASAAVAAAAALPGVGAVERADSAAIVARFGQRASQVGGAPSVGREDQFMRRFVELAQQGWSGLLVDVGKADTAALGAALQAHGAALAYLYRTLVIEELVDTTPRAEAAAAGKL